MLSSTEENYLKQILGHELESREKAGIGTNELAGRLEVKPSTVNVMLKKLREKNLIDYEKYGKISLTPEGRKIGMEIIRKHRLWETFLYEKLDFTWDEVHEIAEQLEHIQSQKLVEKLDIFLGFPSVDPHGDPIPDSQGKLPESSRHLLSEAQPGFLYQLVAVRDNSAVFLKYVQEIGLGINKYIQVVGKQDFDDSLEIEIQGIRSRVSKKFCDHLYVVLNKKA